MSFRRGLRSPAFLPAQDRPGPQEGPKGGKDTNMDMNCGDEVLVYEDPLTEKCVEGKARLLRRISALGGTPTMEIWRVAFIKPGAGYLEPAVDRTIQIH